MFLKNKEPSSAYYGFRAFGQMYKLGNQAEIKNMRLQEDLYALAVIEEDGQALLISNISEKKDRRLKNLKKGRCSTLLSLNNGTEIC